MTSGSQQTATDRRRKWGMLKGAGKASAMRWNGPIRSNKSPTFLFLIKRGQKESGELRLGVTPSISPIPQMGWATRPPCSTTTPLRDVICSFSEDEGIASMLPTRAEPFCAYRKRQSLPHRSPSARKHGWHGNPGIAVLVLFPFSKTTWEGNG